MVHKTDGWAPKNSGFRIPTEDSDAAPLPLRKRGAAEQKTVIHKSQNVSLGGMHIFVEILPQIPSCWCLLLLEISYLQFSVCLLY
jgi:hypothetical protein